MHDVMPYVVTIQSACNSLGHLVDERWRDDDLRPYITVSSSLVDGNGAPVK